MSQQAIFLGSIGVISETSDLQRRAFNLAFHDMGLDWEWEGAGYYAMLRKPGGKGRVMEYAAARGEQVDGAEVHARKLHHFRALALTEGLKLRPGIHDVITAARRADMAVGLVTTTVPETVDLLFDSLGTSLSRDAFDVVIDRSHVLVGKPAPDCYRYALSTLGVDASQSFAIEDTPESQRAALRAGVACAAYPGFAAAGRSFEGDGPVLETLTPELLDAMMPRMRLSA
ncbi:MAG: HAD-IA family hydrolase [Pseudomonadota bacterium]